MNFRAGAVEDDPVALLQIADRIGEGRERDGIGADEHLVVAEPDGERRALAGADQEIGFAREQKRQREGAAQPRQGRLDRLDRRQPAFDRLADEMGDNFGIGLGRELDAVGFEFAAQLGEVLDDAVVDDRERVGGVRVRVVFGRPAVRRPAGVADPDGAFERLAGKLRFQILELAFRAPPRQHAMLERGDAGRIVAAIFEALERVDEQRRDRLVADDSDDAAHPCRWSPWPTVAPDARVHSR